MFKDQNRSDLHIAPFYVHHMAGILCCRVHSFHVPPIHLLGERKKRQQWTRAKKILIITSRQMKKLSKQKSQALHRCCLKKAEMCNFSNSEHTVSILLLCTSSTASFPMLSTRTNVRGIQDVGVIGEMDMNCRTEISRK